MLITVIGSGYVGLVSAVCLAEIGHQVIAVDSDARKSPLSLAARFPFTKSLVPELLHRHNGKRLRFSAFPRTAVTASDVVFLAVGTPQSGSWRCRPLADRSGRERDRSCSASVDIDRGEKHGAGVHVRRIAQMLRASGAHEGWFSVASNPEFLREGSAVTDFLYPDRIVVGADDEFSRFLLREVYRPLMSGSYYRREDAVPSPARAQEPGPIAGDQREERGVDQACLERVPGDKDFVHQYGGAAGRKVGADIDEMCAGMGSDPRIGSEFLRAGMGYGGSCFPKDVAAFEAVARRCGVDFPAVATGGADQPGTALRGLWTKCRRALRPLAGKRIGVLGLSFKEDTDDVRESPAIAIVRELIGDMAPGVRVRSGRDGEGARRYFRAGR